MTTVTVRISWYFCESESWTVAARESELGDISVQFMPDRSPPRTAPKPLPKSLQPRELELA